MSNTSTDRPGTVLVELNDLGGYGDIMAGASILHSLLQHGIQPLVGYGTGEPASKLTELTQPGFRERLQDWDYSDHEDLITITMASDSRKGKKKRQTDVHLHINEYDRDKGTSTASSYVSPYSATMHTGLGFKPGIGDVQAGIYHDSGIDRMIQRPEAADNPGDAVKEMREKTLQQLLESGSGDGVEYLDGRVDEVLDSNWSFGYKRVIDTFSTFFDIFEEAEDRLDEPVYVFLAGEGEIAYQAEERGWSMYDLTDGYGSHDSVERDSPVTLVRLGTVPNQQFKQLNALSDTLSLVTGDHSLSQALQTAGSDLEAPFLYQCPHWKQKLAYNMAEALEESSGAAASMFRGYPFKEGGVTIPGDKIHMKENLARLVYDDTMQDIYNAAAASVEERFIEERRDAGIDEAETLWSVNDTVTYIVDGLLSGKSADEIYGPLLPEIYTRESPLFSQVDGPVLDGDDYREEQDDAYTAGGAAA